LQDDEFMRVDRETDASHRSLVNRLGSLTSDNDALRVSWNGL
jgi:hypothetical protein